MGDKIRIYLVFVEQEYSFNVHANDENDVYWFVNNFKGIMPYIYSR